MPINQFDRILHELARHRNTTGMAERDGYVHEVKGDKMRVVMGVKPDGQPWLSPWVPNFDHRGGSRERKRYEKGQNVRISAPGGDYRQAHVSAGAHSESFPKPAHADNVNGDSYQAGKLRVSSNKVGGDQGGDSSGGQQQGGGDDAHYHDVWISEKDDNPPKHQDQSGQPEQSGGGQQQQGGQQQNDGDDKAAMKLRTHEKTGLTGRLGEGENSFRFQVHKDGVKLCYGDNKHAIHIDKDGIWYTTLPQLKACKIPNDDK